MILKGSICSLRPITIDDAEVTLRWRLSERAKLMQRGATTVDEQRAWIASKLNTGEINCIIEYENVAVGMLALHDINKRHNSAIYGRLLIGEEEIVGNAPVAFEAELLLCDFAFDQLKVHKICGDVVEDNQPMLKLRTYLGYVQDGILRDALNFDGLYKNVHTFSLLEDEYKTKCRPKLVGLIRLLSLNSDKKQGIH